MECPARRMRVASPSKGEGEGRSWANSRERVRKLGARPLTLVLSPCEGNNIVDALREGAKRGKIRRRDRARLSLKAKAKVKLAKLAKEFRSRKVLRSRDKVGQFIAEGFANDHGIVKRKPRHKKNH